MAIFTMSDLHLSLDTDKSMEVFGRAWENYIQRIHDNWTKVVKDSDTVIVGGDISWAMQLKECRKDFDFLNALPGHKLLFKGNHDYWWESMTKMKAFALENGYTTFEFVQNNAVYYDDCLICGTRGWSLPGDGGFGPDDEKIYNREVLRLELSLKEGVEMCQREGYNPKKRICVLHYPPFTRAGEKDKGFTDLMSAYGITHCVYGHLHGQGLNGAFEGIMDGISYRLVSGDHINFVPVEI